MADKILVIYKTKYGSTEQYAKWIAEELNADIYPVAEVTRDTLSAYDVIIFGGYLHIGKIVGIEIVTQNWSILETKKIIVFSVSGSPPEKSDLQTWYAQNVPEQMRSRIRYFPLQGRVKNLDLKDRVLIAFPRTLLRVQYLVTRQLRYKVAVETFKPFDAVTKENIVPLVTFAKEITNRSN